MPNLIKSITTLLVLIYAITNQSCSTHTTKDFSSIDNYFNQHIDSGKIAGAITLIAKNNEILQLKSYGYIDVENSIPMRNEIMIPIASMTKIITSIALLQLHEKKALNIDDPIEQYLPAFKNIKVLVNPDTSLTEELRNKPTIRDFLRHTSGMVYSGGKSVTDKLYREAGFREWEGSTQEFVKKVSEIPLAFQPNKNWSYSYSHDVLGCLIETVSKKPLDQYCREEIFNPLGLVNTDFYIPKEKADQISNLYNYKNGELTIDDNRTSSIYNNLPIAISGGGGWWSSYGGVVTTIKEFLTISRLLLDYGSYNGKTILNKETMTEMITNQIGDFNAYGNKYGLGVGITESSSGLVSENEIFWAGAPYNTYFWVDYKDKVIGILFTNTAPFGHLGMMDKFKELTEEAFSD